MSRLRTAQVEFALALADLVRWANAEPGREITLGEVYRPGFMADEYAKRGLGVSPSIHTFRLAVDVNLFLHGVYQTDSEAYASLGAYWKGLHPDHRWGGDFRRPDGNHFSRAYGGLA